MWPGAGPKASKVARVSVPNPTRYETAIRFSLGSTTGVRIAVYDVAGRLVRVLTDGEWDAGDHAVRWDGLDGEGRRVATGVYFYSMRAPGFEDTRKIVLLR